MSLVGFGKDPESVLFDIAVELWNSRLISSNGSELRT